MRAVGVTGEYIRQIRQAGFAPSADELISMWVHEVTPEFATQVRQRRPAASPNDLIGMRVSGVAPDVALQLQESNPLTSSALPHTWAIQVGTGRNSAIPDRTQLTFFNPGGGIQSNTVAFRPSVFRGLTSAEMMSETQTAVLFDIVREAGTFVCEGNFQGGRGSGTAIFRPNPDYRAQMLALGVQDIDDRGLFTLALLDVTVQSAREIRQRSRSISIGDLIQMKVQTR
jgi:hypothetical protein